MTFRANHLYSNGPEVQGAFGVDSLPLTTVAHIIFYLEDDVASLARLCRTSRVLYYMTLPHLWKCVDLKSYSSIRYKDDVPEGFGSASPFSMGLNALVTRNVSTLVRSLGLEGEFGASDLYEYSRVGRVSESTMILNIAVRAAVDQCVHLEKFRWDLNIRLQPNVYGGLAKLSRLEHLWLRFPTNRLPQPSTDIPALPNLKSLTITHFDPLCFPDDISTLLLHATNLESLQMHFSPRMREQGEASVVIPHIFRKNIAAKKRLRLRRMGVYNLLASVGTPECLEALDTTTCEHFTALNTFGLDEDSLGSHPSTTHFIDRTWLVPVNKDNPKPKSLRLDQLHKRHALDLGKSAGLERLYLVNARYKRDGTNGYANSSPTSAEVSPMPSSGAGSSNRSSRGTPQPNTSLRDLYLDNICGVCGPTLKHLILPARWLLPTPVTARLIRSCPNLTQLSAAIECSDYQVLRMLVPFLSKLWAIRILAPTQEGEGEEAQKNLAAYNVFINEDDSAHEEKMATVLVGTGPNGATTDLPCLRYVGLGPKVWEIGGIIEETVKIPVDGEERGLDQDGNGNGNGNGNWVDKNGKATWREEIVYRRKIKRITEQDVKEVEIWKMDSMDVI
ncbi:uncharacterized protein Z518_03439 [Rhinocladiella mackenziei CBS 650.93]|uniref:Rhinocladiella mackenziei CBS 650.93 unplaced genomic scaffold supercont1.2, whole genome shotgun sequence n=1 Tax=Rhinocladiella mackenziei CBS 650.93 TaxID=1442369 RepID=A0A0D2G2K6_9EURO|nr:uncharacterized protein Z518_03439 [Rhinocladiella mackenziei CBS 650.93]KIX08782.1 hypothetical protein Z518_03439 [Rhinocladiella mackenziei CBS 650.93]